MQAERCLPCVGNCNCNECCPRRRKSALAVEGELLIQIDELQTWFASRPYGWRQNATSGQLQQFADRERELNSLIGRLELARN